MATTETEELGNFEKLAFEVLKAETKMDDEQRLQFWSVIQQPYCKNCGRVLDGGLYCYCNDDD